MIHSASSRLALLFLLASAAQTVYSQSPDTHAPAPATVSNSSATPLRFDVVSIHPHQPNGDEPSNRRVLPGGRFIATNTTLRTLIRIAFASDDDRIFGEPEWAGEAFDINGTIANRTDITSPDQLSQLLLSLLEERFQFKFHRAQKEAPIYRLELNSPGKLGSALRPSNPDTQPNMSTNSNGATTTMKVTKASMADVAATLARQAHRPVEDHTGLQGNFDFQIEWAPDENPNSAAPSLFTVLTEQLGLKLRPAKGSVDTFVIDQIARPTAN